MPANNSGMGSRGGRGSRRWEGGRLCARRVGRFVEPCLLLLLHRDMAHGYDLSKALEDIGLAGASVDSSVVYRVLREMEEREWVTSTWDTDGSGPPRRVYRMTQQGDRALSTWVDDLRQVRESLDRYLAAYEQHIREGHGEHH